MGVTESWLSISSCWRTIKICTCELLLLKLLFECSAMSLEQRQEDEQMVLVSLTVWSSNLPHQLGIFADDVPKLF